MSCKNSCTCKSKKFRYSSLNSFPFLSGLLIALLPKCPLCILAYSSAITMCSGSTLNMTTNSWTSYLPLVFAIITLGLILYNYKGRKTILAALLVVVGSILILNATLYLGSFENYYLGTFLLLFGIWINGSFLYFFKRLLSTIQNKRKNTNLTSP